MIMKMKCAGRKAKQMSNLKRDIEKVLRNLVYTIEAPSSNKGTEFTVSADVSENNVKKIINLIEKSEQKLLAKMTLDCKTVDYQGEQWNAILVKKLKNITFEQDEDIPNGAWGKNSLKKDIREEILDILRWPYNKRPVRLTQSEALRQQRATDILNLIESVIPEPDKHTWRAYGQPDGTVVCDHCNLAEDVNNLLSSQVADIKSKLIGEE